MDSVFNPKTGAKTTGVISTWQQILTLPLITKIRTDAQALATLPLFDLDICAHGADISKWQGDPHWSTLLSMTDLVTVRAGYGTTYDPMWTTNREPLRAAKDHIRGIYWYYNTGATAEQQTNIILEALEYFQPGQLETFDLDIEKSYNAYWSTTFRTDPLKILQNIKRARPDIRVRQYWNLDVWQNCLMANPAYLEFPIWFAWYPYKPLETALPPLPRNVGYQHIDLWQYWADGNGLGPDYGVESHSIDLNRSRDPLETYYELLKGEPIIEPEPEPEPEPCGCCNLMAQVKQITDKWIPCDS